MVWGGFKIFNFFLLLILFREFRELSDEEGCKAMRSAMERFNAWLKTFRRAIIRYERHNKV